MSLLTSLPALLQSSPDAALWTLLAGILLIDFELNRPGTILPGCFGALLTLLAIHAFALMHLRPIGLVLVAAGLVFILSELAVPTRNLAALAGTSMLATGLVGLVQPFAPARVHTPTAVLFAVGFACSTLWLARIALQARRNKRTLALNPRRTPASLRVD